MWYIYNIVINNKHSYGKKKNKCEPKEIYTPSAQDRKTSHGKGCNAQE